MFAALDANGWVAIIGAVGVVLVQLLTRWMSHLEHKETTYKMVAVQENVQKIETATNSMMAERDKAKIAEGELAGRAALKQEQKDAP